MNRNKLVLKLTLACVLILAACAPTAASPTTTGIPTTAPTQIAAQEGNLTVGVVYPTPDTEIEMGQPFKGIVKVVDEQGRVVKDAQVNMSIADSEGNAITSVPTSLGNGDVYRTVSWIVPHKMQAGIWTVTADAKAGMLQGQGSSTFKVRDSISEILLKQYGFWIESPSLRGIVPSVVKEQGDAENGMIIWGGMLPAQHVFPESWLQIHWRKGNFNLQTAQDVHNFMLGTLGDLGFTAVRDLGPFQQVKFKDWDAWQVKARGLYLRYDEQWMIFYAPEVDKTYAIGTTVVLPPAGMDAHAYLRDSFEVHPEVHASGTAPEPLPHLLPAPELVSPELGASFFGTAKPIILKWQPVKELAPDEYYLVSVDYNYEEANPAVDYTTRETQFTLPTKLYQLKNCGVFNWQITLMKQTGTSQDGQPEGKPLSFSSLYWYVQWSYPAGKTPFKLLCPNAQF